MLGTSPSGLIMIGVGILMEGAMIRLRFDICHNERKQYKQGFHCKFE